MPEKVSEILKQKRKRIEKLKKEERRLDRIEYQMVLMNYDMEKCPQCNTLQEIKGIEIVKIPKKGKYLKLQTQCSPGCDRFGTMDTYRILTEEQLRKMRGKKK